MIGLKLLEKIILICFPLNPVESSLVRSRIHRNLLCCVNLFQQKSAFHWWKKYTRFFFERVFLYPGSYRANEHSFTFLYILYIRVVSQMKIIRKVWEYFSYSFITNTSIKAIMFRTLLLVIAMVIAMLAQASQAGIYRYLSFDQVYSVPILYVSIFL